jgi:L-histidine N-alpha-methyltransferase
MSAGYQVLGPQIISDLHDPVRDFADDVLVGLSERPKRIASKYFYDEAGSRYFQRIMRVPEYYPTRCETEILEQYASDIIAPLAGAPFNLVDLGAGDGEKTLIILERLRQAGADFTYVPIDISEAAMKGLVATVRARMPDVKVAGLVCEYAHGVAYLGREQSDRRSLVLFLGSNIGNFNVARARSFMRRLWSALREDDRVLVGFDLKKDIEVLLAAYNDREGITSAFNLNLLTRMNRELGATFDPASFRHFGTYNVFSGAMESYLVSLEPQIVRVEALDISFAFDAWEPLHTEYSYKYLRSDIDSLAKHTGFACDARFEDRRGWFVDALFRVMKAPPAPKPRD